MYICPIKSHYLGWKGQNNVSLSYRSSEKKVTKMKLYVIKSHKLVQKQSQNLKFM